ncbi:hypothetical protein [Smaragdicoccus niigatensis]|uniref:hypothetical protein n=1 Tax=Smaragdicoccus niigatensis TaxID=359359 RepID=UPI000364079A|nr:hypothetical protein [Smaragdicoccus niigatensis]
MISPPTKPSRESAHRTRGGRPYPRIIWATIGLNVLVAGVTVLTAHTPDGWLDTAILIVSINIFLAGLAREQYFVNGLFAVASSAPKRWPLKVRSAIAHIHHAIGGVHAGAAVSATAWFVLYAALTIIRPMPSAGPAQHAAIVTVLILISLDLVVMVILARPVIREKHHDLFEHSHRYGGWLALALFVALTLLHAAAQPGPAWKDMVGSPNTWILLALLIIAAIPWLQLRRVKVEIQRPSDHVALVRFPDRQVMAGSAGKVAHHPLGQWHAFANVVTGDDGYRIAVSRAGRWTSKFIAEPPSHLWVRGIPTTGVGSLSRMFTRVVWVATGSGIAPVLPHLITGHTPGRLIWVTRNSLRTYGPDFRDEIRASEPGLIEWDTDELGKPDLVSLSHETLKETGAEAVIVISNKRTTLRLVSELRARGVPAFGPIWDS